MQLWGKDGAIEQNLGQGIVYLRMLKQLKELLPSYHYIIYVRGKAEL